MVNVFAIPVFFICLRESLETSIIVSILLAFLKRTLGPEKDPKTYRKLVRQVWLGTFCGAAICLAAGAGFVAAFYTLGADHWAGTEKIWEGSFGLLAAIIITVVGAALLRVSKLQDKWRAKIEQALQANDSTQKRSVGRRFKMFCEKYAMFMLPFVTILREGLEAVVFMCGVSLGLPASAFPLAVFGGLGVGCVVGFAIYRGGNMASIQSFLIISTCFLYLVAAGLFSKAVHFFEAYKWDQLTGLDSSETGSGPGSYDIRQSVWHVNCCSPDINGGGGWGVFNSLFGWQNSATYGSVISYNLYWLLVIVGFATMKHHERTGHYPFIKAKEVKISEKVDIDAEPPRTPSFESVVTPVTPEAEV